MNRFFKKFASVSFLFYSFLFLLIFIGGLFAAEDSLASLWQEVEEYEKEGHYVNALILAKQGRIEIKSEEQEKEFLSTKTRLEKAILQFGFSHLFFDEKAQAKPKLKELLCLAGMPPTFLSRKSINAWAQTHLLRKGERWEKQTEQFDANSSKMKVLLKELGFLKAVSPSFSSYEGALIHGGFLPRVRSRLGYLLEQWKKGVRFSHLYFLSGSRDLDPLYENEQTFSTSEDLSFLIQKGWSAPKEPPKTEWEMIKMLWEQVELPQDMRKQIQVDFIYAPKKQGPIQGKWVRPTTEDTVLAWLKTNPTPGRYLSVSNAPYLPRQDLIVRGLSPEKYGFDSIGPEAEDQEKIAVFLDELARMIFQIQQITETRG